MSTLKVDTITKADGTGSLSVPAESGTVVTTASPSLGRRNIIINGAMQVAQRGTSETGLTSSIGYKTVDRFGGNTYNAGSHTYNDEQSTDAPSEFSFSRKFTWTTAQTTNTATRNQMRHHIEYENMRHLKWGTSDAKPAILSFWVKSNVTGLHPFSLVSGGETDSFVTNYTVNVANTWEYKTISIPAPTSGTFNASTIGIRMAWDFGSGDNFNAPSANSWVSGWYFRTSSSIRVAETTNATWQITGVQLEVGSVATPFEHRSYGEELALCQRYFTIVLSQNEGAGMVGACDSSTYVRGFPYFPVTMRATPTLVESDTGIIYRFNGAVNANNDSTPPGIDLMDVYGGSMAFTGFSGLSAGQGGAIRINNASSPSGSYVAFDAEL